MRRVIANLSYFGLLLAVLLAASPASANVLTSILREAGEAGGSAAGHMASELGALAKAAAHLKGLTHAPKGALAAHATPEGHWQFVNREGQTFTAGTPDELKRVLPSLAPDAVGAGDTKLSLYLSEDSVFDNRGSLDQLPKDADLHVVTDSGAYPVTRKGSGNSATLHAAIKPNLSVELADRQMFNETLSYLGRGLNKANIRTVAFEPGAAKRLSSAPKFDAATKAPLVDMLDPSDITRAFASIRGQTVLVTGRIDNGKIFFSPSTGPELSRDIEELVNAAAESDVNLVVMHTDASRQPGGRNWLWQTIEAGGLRDASKATTFGDFLDVLGAKRGGFQLTAAREGLGRVQIAATQADAGGSLARGASSVLEQTVGHVTGEIVTKAVNLHGRDDSAQQEVDAQLIPGIPAYIQIPYFVSLFAGLISWATIRGWWRRIWPLPEQVEGVGRGRAKLRNLARELVFFAAFLPVAGVPSLLWQMAVQTWANITAPFRWFAKRFLRREV